ncbi:hypothetical protein D3C84_803680 [compost metagenome]
MGDLHFAPLQLAIEHAHHRVGDQAGLGIRLALHPVLLGDDVAQQLAVCALRLVGVALLFLVEVDELAGHQDQSVPFKQSKADECLDKTT